MYNDEFDRYNSQYHYGRSSNLPADDYQPAGHTPSPEEPLRQPKKPGFFKRLGRFFRELKAELKKVAWPTRADTMKKTGVVILCVIVVGVIVWIFDGIASGVVNALLALFGG